MRRGLRPGLLYFDAAKILAMTVGTVFSAEGISAPSYVSAPEFRGEQFHETPPPKLDPKSKLDAYKSIA